MQTATLSAWARRFERRRSFPTLTEDVTADVAIVGGGITGLTAGALLARDGLRAVVVERNQIGSGTTGSSTAHLTASLDLSFSSLVSRFGEESARLAIESVMRSIDEIEKQVNAAGRDCGFRRVPGFRFAEREDEAEPLVREAELARSLGLRAECVREVPLPFPCIQAIRFEDQAQLDPLAYVEWLAESLTASGGMVFEHSPVVEANDDGLLVAGGARVRARHVVEATQTPLGLVASIQTRLAAITSYVLEATLTAPLERGLFWDCADPYHYVRAVSDDGRSILVGGSDHHTGREADPAARLAALEAWTRARFPVASIETHWSHELFEPADGLPYIGLLPGARSHWLAAGFSGTGLTFGTVGALLLRDLIKNGSSPWAELYSPSRVKPLVSALPIAEENLRIGWRFVADRLRRGTQLDTLPPDSGRVERIEKRQVAVYRDLRGDLHFLSPRCPHLGCIVAWNDLEKTWDCPCHGGRFHPTGKVIYGPPTAGLEHEHPSPPDPDAKER